MVENKARLLLCIFKLCNAKSFQCYIHLNTCVILSKFQITMFIWTTLSKQTFYGQKPGLLTQSYSLAFYHWPRKQRWVVLLVLVLVLQYFPVLVMVLMVIYFFLPRIGIVNGISESLVLVLVKSEKLLLLSLYVP